MSIQQICDGIESVIKKCRVPLTYIPATILVCSAVQRPGLSAMVIASNIIKRQAEAGAPFGPSADGTRNVSEAMERIRIEEMVKALKLDSRVQIGLPIGGISVTATGMSPSGPVTVTGFNTNNAHGDGIIG